jgi:hypothetical protein
LAAGAPDERLSGMRGLIWLVLAASAAGCAVESFDYRATVTFTSELGTVRLNHQPVASGAVWAASYSSFSDALRDPSVIEIGDRTLTIGPDACAVACTDCQFDRATLVFSLAGDHMNVTGTCGEGDRLVEVR